MNKWKNWKYEIEIDPLRIYQAIAEIGMLVFLGMYEVAAQWTHINRMGSVEGWLKTLMSAGTLGTQFGLLALVLGSCFVFSTGVRVYCGVALILCSLVILFHTGGITSFDSAMAQGQSAVSAVAKEMRENNRVATEAMGGTIAEAGSAGGRYRSQNIREAADGVQDKSASLAAQANEQVVKLALETDQKAREKTYFPEWYMNGPMYVVLFGLVHLCVAIGAIAIEVARRRADKNGNGHPDWAELNSSNYDPVRAARYWTDFEIAAKRAEQQRKQAMMAERRLAEVQANITGNPPTESPKAYRH